VSALPLDGAAPPRLASASLEALGELAQATGISLQPWVKKVVPHVLAIMQDQSSASKQRTSLRTLGQIAGCTGYVIRPYLDYPKLLSQATDILPATKRAPWSLRREVIRTLGILGALDPDRYYLVASKRRKGGAVGGAYFEELDSNDAAKGTQLEPLAVTGKAAPLALSTGRQNALKIDPERQRSGSDLSQGPNESDDDLPACLFMYEQYAMIAQPVSSLLPAKRMSPSDDDFFPTVAIQGLMRIFRDPSLAVHHGMVAQAIMFIFKSLGLKCVPFLNKVVPHMIYTARTCSPSNLRESLLKQLATLSLIVREHLRPYVADIFDVAELFWSSRHLASIFSLISNIVVGVPDEFRLFVPRLIQKLLITLDELQVADWSSNEAGNPLLLSKGSLESQKLALILRSIGNLRGVLGSYLHILVPALLKLADSLASVSASGDSILPESSLEGLSALAYRTISALVESQNSSSTTMVVGSRNLRPVEPKSSENGLPSRVVQPIVRVFREKPPKSPTVGIAMIECLCVCARQIGGPKWVKLYDGVVRTSINGWQESFATVLDDPLSPSPFREDSRAASVAVYDQVVAELLLPPSDRTRISLRKNSQLNPAVGNEDYRYSRIASAGDFSVVGMTFDTSGDTFDQQPMTTLVHSGNRTKINQGNLQRAWDVSQLASRDDWDEWMRRFAIQLLRDAPSPALRASASLAHAYQPLARELFSAAFSCCWQELNERYRENLVHALETAFVADVSPEILQALLNLAGFMEHDPGGGLPIHISILADLALKCRAYAKALHYKEREYSSGGGSNSCVEALISINRKLDLQGTSNKTIIHGQHVFETL
jgi:FKBP12-rapamycin complex-associated protein